MPQVIHLEACCPEIPRCDKTLGNPPAYVLTVLNPNDCILRDSDGKPILFSGRPVCVGYVPPPAVIPPVVEPPEPPPVVPPPAPVPPPTAHTTSATGVDLFSATLNGTVNPNGYATTIHFQWGTTTGYGNTTTHQTAGAGISTIPVSFALSGLEFSVVYHYRIVATNAGGTVYGDDSSFTTIPCDADALDWAARVVTAGGTVSASTVDAACAFVRSVKNVGVWDKLKRVNLYAGGDIAAASVPLKKVWGDPTDTLQHFVGGDYSESTGLAGSFIPYGASVFALKLIFPGIDVAGMDPQNYHYSVYNRTATNEPEHCIRWFNNGFPTTETALGASYNGTSYFFSLDSTTPVSFVDGFGTGLYIGSRVSNNLATLYKNGASVGTTGVGAGTFAGNAAVTIHGTSNNLGLAGSTSRALSFYSFGLGLTDSDAAALYAAVQAFQTALGRAV